MYPNNKFVRRLRFLALALFLPASVVIAQNFLSEPDPRMKSDVLLVIAHPDDETALGSFLAKLALDDGKKIAVVYCNRGTGGGNSVGNEQGTAMGMIREIEGREALLKLGITNVWVLSGEDTPGQDLFRSLQNWGHGRILEDIVRLIRLTRPEVVLTWLPAFVAGENHGDHQAAGVIATEAFHLACNPASFPAQVVTPRERTDINNSTEGLQPWQPKKLYYFSDANHALDIPGPTFDITSVSPSRGVPYYRLAAELHKPHRTQRDVSEIALDAERTGNYDAFRQWLELYRPLFGKSVVPCDPKGDLFEGIGMTPQQPTVDQIEEEPREVLRLGGPFEFYRNFWRMYGIGYVAKAVRPELEIGVGSYVHVPLLLKNSADDSLDIALSVNAPSGWKVAAGSGTYRIGPKQTAPIQCFLIAPAVSQKAGEIDCTARVKGKIVGRTAITVTVNEWTLPQ